jgi:hypothetical protein
MANFDSLVLTTEGISGGAVTVLMDNVDLPSFMVPFYKMNNKQLFGGSETTHPAFMIDGAEKDAFYASKYINTVVDTRAYSWPNVIPSHSKNFDNEMSYCNNKGDGWHQMSIAEWAVIMHLIYKSGFIPRGNTNYGAHHEYTYEVGSKGSDISGRTATGSGPATWCHDGLRTGIADFVGNLWKRLSGMRLVNGEIQVMVGNLPALQVSHAASSTYWKAILASDGSLVDPGTSGTLRVNSSGNIGTTAVTSGEFNKLFSDVVAADSIAIPEIVYALGLAPVSGVSTVGRFYGNLEGERIPLRGGSFGSLSGAGPSALYLSDARSDAGSVVGFFSAYQK